jgi:hypothetical protein
VATACDGRTLDYAALAWYIDGERVGRGPEAWVALSAWESEHRCTLVATGWRNAG